MSSAEIERHCASEARVYVETPARDVSTGGSKPVIVEFLTTDDAGWDPRCH